MYNSYAPPEPVKSISNLQGDNKEIAQLAVSRGVIIHPNGTFQPLMQEHDARSYKKPSLEQLQGAVEGYIELVEIPSNEPGKAPTILVVNEEGRITDKVFNRTASQLFLMELYGSVVWLPRKWV